MPDRTYHVYIVTNKRHTVLYTGMTGRGEMRIIEHKQRRYPKSFTYRYHVGKLVYVDAFPTASEAAEAERIIKGWTRAKKIALINSINPTWEDLIDREPGLRMEIERGTAGPNS